MALEIATAHASGAVGPSSSAESIPPRTRLLQNISTQTQLINQIFTSLSSSTSSSSSSTLVPTPNPLPALYQTLNDTSEDLLRLREDVAVHQQLWARIEAKKRNVIDLERRVRGIMRTLERERGELETMVQEGREIMSSVDKVEKNPIHIPSLLSHAHALAKHSSAPISSLLTPIDKAQYQPWPTENAMRQGLLFQMEGSMSGVGQTGQIGDESKEDVVMAEAPVAVQMHREEQARRYDPEAVFTLDLNSDSEDE